MECNQVPRTTPVFPLFENQEGSVFGVVPTMIPFYFVFSETPEDQSLCNVFAQIMTPLLLLAQRDIDTIANLITQQPIATEDDIRQVKLALGGQECSNALCKRFERFRVIHDRYVQMIVHVTFAEFKSLIALLRHPAKPVARLFAPALRKSFRVSNEGMPFSISRFELQEQQTKQLTERQKTRGDWLALNQPMVESHLSTDTLRADKTNSGSGKTAAITAGIVGLATGSAYYIRRKDRQIAALQAKIKALEKGADRGL